ncbi:hypothetical protein [Halalkaliarchaeum desulfuricum]|uniref:hypothetical protein n=1 Tax=Halalkaliarchaeum desulfuricum TaxID=2055893 RepID=UPI000E6C451D|nr:hypothetical protein [Halalkaliarchaeum desulfuricum]
MREFPIDTLWLVIGGLVLLLIVTGTVAGGLGLSEESDTPTEEEVGVGGEANVTVEGGAEDSESESTDSEPNTDAVDNTSELGSYIEMSDR